jgi:hypothetical protein
VLLAVVGIGLGLAIGFGLRGSIGRLTEVHLRWWPLAVLGLAMQVVPVPSADGNLDRWVGAALLAGSYVVLLVFVSLNIGLPGFPLLAVGLALNALVISLNGGMPVGDGAIRAAAGDRYAYAIRQLRSGEDPKHHLAGPGDVLAQLGDVIPVGPPIKQILSVGDVVAIAGTVWLVAGLMLSKGSKRTGGASPRPEEASSPAAPPIDQDQSTRASPLPHSYSDPESERDASPGWAAAPEHPDAS